MRRRRRKIERVTFARTAATNDGTRGRRDQESFRESPGFVSNFRRLPTIPARWTGDDNLAIRRHRTLNFNGGDLFWYIANFAGGRRGGTRQSVLATGDRRVASGGGRKT